MPTGFGQRVPQWADAVTIERQLWHSHGYEVTSGFLVEPGMPERAYLHQYSSVQAPQANSLPLPTTAVDHVIMKDVLVGTYGKTFHTWRYDQKDNPIPLGIPELVMGYTGDDQVTPGFVTARDHLFGINTTAVRESRKDITRKSHRSSFVPANIIKWAE